MVKASGVNVACSTSITRLTLIVFMLAIYLLRVRVLVRFRIWVAHP